MPIRRVLSTAILVLAGGAIAAGLPYDEAANAKADVERALAMASTTKRSVLVIFGANWCEDCRALDVSLKNTRNAELVAKEFVVVKVDVGNFDRNLGLAAQYGTLSRLVFRRPSCCRRAIKFSTRHVRESYPTLGA